MIRVAVLSFWHVHAWDYTEQALADPGVEVVAVWDEDPARGTVEAAKLEVPFIANLDELLARPDVDAVIVVAPTRMHRDVLVAAAAAGKHIFTEKVIAPTVGELDEVLAAVRAAGVVLAVSLPFLTRGHIETLDGLVARGELGDLTRARVILSHDGALSDWLPEQFFDADDTQGGAMIDLGCHPMYLTRHFLGRPETVSATYASVTGRDVEDNAVAILRYGNGALGIVEAGFATAHAPFTLELHGTRGSALYDWASDTIRVRTADDDAWRTLEAAPDAPMPFDRFVERVLQGDAYAGIDADEHVTLAIELTHLMDAANRSAALNSAPVALASLDDTSRGRQ